MLIVLVGRYLCEQDDTWHLKLINTITSSYVMGPEIFSAFPYMKAVPGKNWQYYSCGIYYQYTGQADSWHIAAPRLLPWSNSYLASVRATPVSGPGNWMDFYTTLTGNWMHFAPVCTLHAYLDKTAVLRKWNQLVVSWAMQHLGKHHKPKVAKLDCGGHCFGLWEPWQ